MNKIISISINGIIFNVDEQAYLTLKNYLDTLKLHFSGTEGSEEILDDIEARIAEMLNERLKGRKEVVTAEDVATVMATMGRAEDMGGAENPGTKNTSGEYTYQRTTHGARRVFRNPDDKVLGGVCSGVAVYFNIDPLILRLLFVVAFFGFGSGFLLYIILWIIIPEAKTPSEKLEMRGEKVNVSNIEKTVKENLDDFKKKVNEWGDEIKNTDTNKLSNFFSSLASDFLRVLKPFITVLVKIIAVLLAILAGMILVALVVSVLGVSGTTESNLPAFIYDIFESRNEMMLGSLGIALVFGIPVIGLLYYSLRLIFNLKYSNRYFGAFLGIAWLAGFALMATIAVKTIKKFGTEETLVENVELNNKSKVLYLDVNKNSYGEYAISYNQPDENKLVKVKVNSNEISKVEFDIEKSETGRLELIKEYTAHGQNEKDARINASKIEYKFVENDSQLIFDEIFNVSKGNKWRAQQLKLILKIPVGQTIIMKDGMENIIYDIDNTTNTYDGDMIGYKWLMTENGLTCIDCKPGDKDANENWDARKNAANSDNAANVTLL